MAQTYNVYCDESCHLENDYHPIMVLGAVWIPAEKTREIADNIRKIKTQHGLSHRFEIKWTKVSPAKQDFYLDLLDYFFSDIDLHFRALIASKIGLRHELFNQDHNLWYYKMYFDMLKIILSPYDRYRIYLDIKDTLGGEKVRNLHDVLCNNMFDFSKEIIERIQIIRSHESEIMQLADLLIGVISAVNRQPVSSPSKIALIERMRVKSGYSLTKTTLYREMKVNLFYWYPKS
jgi:hypothetical protein